MLKHIFRSAAHTKKISFSTKFLRFGSPWEMWILKLFRRHQFFEAMLILKVPGLRNIIFEEFYVFGKQFSIIFSEQVFFSARFSRQDFFWPDLFLAGCGEFFFWGVGPEKLLQWFTLDFQKLFWSRNGSPWELWSCTAPSFSGNFKPRPILSTNRA